MNAQQEATLSTLYDLIETCRDGQEGFKKASEYVVDDPGLKMLLASFSLQRARFAGELESKVAALGGELSHHEHRSSVGGTLHRWWMDLKSSVVRGDNHSILEECERGEDVAMENYRKALANDEVPDSIRGIILRQQQDIVNTHNTVKSLRDASPANLDDLVHSAAQNLRAKGESIYSDLSGKASEMWEGAQGQIEGADRKMRRSMRENPYPILALALGVGALIGLAFYAIELRNERARIDLRRRPLKRLGLNAQASLLNLRDKAQNGLDAMQTRVEEFGLQRKQSSLMHKLRAAWHTMMS